VVKKKKKKKEGGSKTITGVFGRQGFIAEDNPGSEAVKEEVKNHRGETKKALLDNLVEAGEKGRRVGGSRARKGRVFGLSLRGRLSLCIKKWPEGGGGKKMPGVVREIRRKKETHFMGGGEGGGVCSHREMIIFI